MQLGKAYGGLRLFKGLDMMISRGDKIALLGKNGVGKSTLIRMIMKEEPHEGEFKWGYSVNVGYYAQNQSDELDGNKTVFETIDDEAVGEVRKSVRSLLGAFLFSGDDVDKKVKVLSGGEKARLALCKLLLQPYNFLVLDEPTNHLDLASKDVLKQALQRYDGTMLVVSHDRDFLDGLTSTIYEILPDRLRVWAGDVKDFLREKKAASIAAFEANKKGMPDARPKEVPAPAKGKDDAPALSREEQKELEKQRKRKEQQVQKIEQEIARAEVEIKRLDEVIAALDYTDTETSQAELNRYAQARTKLDELYAQWSELSEEA
jgi:ATP-binding cassette subfamily F protein 3